MWHRVKNPCLLNTASFTTTLGTFPSLAVATNRSLVILFHLFSLLLILSVQFSNRWCLKNYVFLGFVKNSPIILIHERLFWNNKRRLGRYHMSISFLNLWFLFAGSVRCNRKVSNYLRHVVIIHIILCHVCTLSVNFWYLKRLHKSWVNWSAVRYRFNGNFLIRPIEFCVWVIDWWLLLNTQSYSIWSTVSRFILFLFALNANAAYVANLKNVK